MNELKSETTIEASDTLVDIGLEGNIPRGYIPSNQRRMEAVTGESVRLVISIRLIAFVMILRAAYGAAPTAVDRLLERAEIRLAAAMIGVRSMLLRAPDVIFRTSDAMRLQQAFAGVKGTLRVVGTPDRSGEIQVYFRPPENYLEPGSLAAILRARLLPEAKSRM